MSAFDSLMSEAAIEMQTQLGKTVVVRVPHSNDQEVTAIVVPAASTDEDRGDGRRVFTRRRDFRFVAEDLLGDTLPTNATIIVGGEEWSVETVEISGTWITARCVIAELQAHHRPGYYGATR